MTRPLATCQCARATSACKRTVTQEDFLCDICRAGCMQIGFGTMGAAPEDIKADGHYEPIDLGLSYTIGAS